MKLKQAEDICAANFPNSLVIFNPRTHHSYILNETAALVWNLCRKPKNLSQISRFLNRGYQVDLSKAKKDTTRLIRQLRKKELILCQ